MAKVKKQEVREERILMEIVVDAYDSQERALGWYYYLQDNLTIPFTATCISQRAISPLRVGDEVEVIGMPPEDECEHEIFVNIQWDRREGLAVPLSQLKPISHTDSQTIEAIKDWHYWVKMGYQF